MDFDAPTIKTCDHTSGLDLKDYDLTAFRARSTGMESYWAMVAILSVIFILTLELLFPLYSHCDSRCLQIDHSHDSAHSTVSDI